MTLGHVMKARRFSAILNQCFPYNQLVKPGFSQTLSDLISHFWVGSLKPIKYVSAKQLANLEHRLTHGKGASIKYVCIGVGRGSW